jgi:hypothetical protein
MAMMMDAGKSRSPARVLRRLVGAAVAAVLLRRTFSPTKWYALCFSFRSVLPWRRHMGLTRVAVPCRAGDGLCVWQQDGGADGDGADEAAAEPAGGAGAPDAPRHRRAIARPPG